MYQQTKGNTPGFHSNRLNIVYVKALCTEKLLKVDFPLAVGQTRDNQSKNSWPNPSPSLARPLWWTRAAPHQSDVLRVGILSSAKNSSLVSRTMQGSAILLWASSWIAQLHVTSTWKRFFWARSPRVARASRELAWTFPWFIPHAHTDARARRNVAASYQRWHTRAKVLPGFKNTRSSHVFIYCRYPKE